MKFIKESIPYLIIVMIVVLIRSFIITPVMVNGKSMKPTLNNHDIVLLKKFNNKIKRKDIVVIDIKNEKIIKRVIGLPGETVKYENGKLYVNGKKVFDEFAKNTYDFNMLDLKSSTIPEDCYLVLGDNRMNSLDSRQIGFINKQNIQGIVTFRLFPFNKIGTL